MYDSLRMAVDTCPTSQPNASFDVRAYQGSVKIVEPLADEWRDLCSRASNDQPFFRPEFIAAHIRAVSPRAKVMLIAARRNGCLHLVLPLIEEFGTFSKVPLRRFRAPVNFNCGRFDAVRSAGLDGDVAVAATWNFLKKMKGWDLLQINDTQDGSTAEKLASSARSDGYLTIQKSDRPNPYVPVPTSPDLLDKMPPNSKLRSQMRQSRRRLAEQGPLKFYRVDTADRALLDRFFELEASGWKGEKRTAVNCDPSMRQFFNELAESAARFGYFSLYMLEWKGQLIAAHFALTYRSRCYSPIVTYDEAFKQFAPGHLIIGEILRDCASRGIHGYDITGQDQDWKMKWTSETHPVSHHFVFNGRIGKLAFSLANRIRPSVEDFVRRTPGGA